MGHKEFGNLLTRDCTIAVSLEISFPFSLGQEKKKSKQLKKKKTKKAWIATNQGW
jgi:hypothetical protein